MLCPKGYLRFKCFTVMQVSKLLHVLTFGNKQLTVFYPQKHTMRWRAKGQIPAHNRLEMLLYNSIL